MSIPVPPPPSLPCPAPSAPHIAPDEVVATAVATAPYAAEDAISKSFLEVSQLYLRLAADDDGARGGHSAQLYVKAAIDAHEKHLAMEAATAERRQWDANGTTAALMDLI